VITAQDANRGYQSLETFRPGPPFANGMTFSRPGLPAGRCSTRQTSALQFPTRLSLIMQTPPGMRSLCGTRWRRAARLLLLRQTFPA
jgi:hypothetical protein